MDINILNELEDDALLKSSKELFFSIESANLIKIEIDEFDDTVKIGVIFALYLFALSSYECPSVTSLTSFIKIKLTRQIKIKTPHFVVIT